MGIGVEGKQWYFSNKVFVEFKTKLEERIKWRYSGEIDLLILQISPESRSVLNFQNYVRINVSKGLRDKYMDSFMSFKEVLVRIAKKKTDTKEAMAEMRKQRINIKEIIVSAIEDNKNIPTPVKSIVAARLFYCTANTF